MNISTSGSAIETTLPAGPVALPSTFGVEELARRPSRAADYRSENRALLALAHALAVAPRRILQSLADSILELLRADSAGVSLFSTDEDGEHVHWPAIAGMWAPYMNGRMRRAPSTLGGMVEGDEPLLIMGNVQFRQHAMAPEPAFCECLRVPLRVRDECIGTLWAVAHRAERKFDTEDLRVLASLSEFASSAHVIWESLTAAAPFAAIVESSDDAILSKDLNSTIQTWNSGAERLFGYTAQEAIGKSVTMLIPEERYDEEPNILARIRRGERISHYETVRRCKDGSLRHVSLTVSPVHDARGRVVGASKIARDITERKRADESIRRSQEDLRRLTEELSEASRRKDEFLALLAHELRNPLAPISNALQLVKSARGDSETFRSALEVLQRQIAQMVRLVDDLLDLSRISRGTIELRRERIELASVVEHAVESARSYAQCLNHELAVQLPSQPVYLNADAARLAQVLGNLLNNACKYTDKGGHISLRAELEGAQVVIRVRDNGMGIANEQLHRIFEPFMQVDASLERSQSGLGIGLTLVKRLVEMHGGTVEALSAGLGLGSELIVHLPVLVEEDQAPASAARVDDARTVRGRRILIVDDNRDAAVSLAMLLEFDGNETRAVHDGAAAMKAAAEFHPDVILLDIGLPLMNGYDTARAIRQHPWGKDLILVAVTGWGQPEDRQRSKDAGFDAHLVKPLDHAMLGKLLGESRLER